MKGAGISASIVGRRGMEDKSADSAPWGDGEIFDGKGAGEGPRQGLEGAAEEVDWLQHEQAPAMAEGDVAPEERVEGWCEPGRERPGDGQPHIGVVVFG